MTMRRRAVAPFPTAPQEGLELHGALKGLKWYVNVEAGLPGRQEAQEGSPLVPRASYEELGTRQRPLHLLKLTPCTREPPGDAPATTRIPSHAELCATCWQPNLPVCSVASARPCNRSILRRAEAMIPPATLQHLELHGARHRCHRQQCGATVTAVLTGLQVHEIAPVIPRTDELELTAPLRLHGLLPQLSNLCTRETELEATVHAGPHLLHRLEHTLASIASVALASSKRL
mmetsp:Transcript_13470/g.31641  ORF Transcript_13470/g.31641 Transcript_13470/m.31641 type:complete len:232 (-) Transcript_13470:2985-3680(-)